MTSPAAPPPPEPGIPTPGSVPPVPPGEPLPPAPLTYAPPAPAPFTAATYGPPGAFPPYGPPGAFPPYGPPEPVPPKPGTNGFAIAAFIMALLAFMGGLLFSVVFGIIALVQTKRSRQKGRGLAIASLVISGVWIAGLAVLLTLALTKALTVRDDNGQLTEETYLSLSDLRVGDCIKDVREDDDVAGVTGVPCAQSHEGEIYAIFDMPAGAYPSDDTFGDECWERLESYSAWAFQAPSTEIYYLFPTSGNWGRGDREVICIAVDEGGRTGSIKD